MTRRPKDTWLQLGLHCTALVLGTVVSLWLLWWMDDWVTAIIAAIGTGCVSLLIYGRHLYLFETRIEQDTEDRLRAHRLAGEAWLGREREKDAATVNQLMDQLGEARRLAIAAEERARAIEAKLPARDARGKFAKRPPRPALGHEKAGQTTRPVLLLPYDPVDGSEGLGP